MNLFRACHFPTNSHITPSNLQLPASRQATFGYPHYAKQPTVARITLLLLAVLNLLLFSPTLAIAQIPDAEVDFFVVPPEENQPFTVGDHIILRLEVTHPVDSRVELPRLEEQWEDLDVINQTEPDTVRNGDGTATTKKDFVVALYEPGQYQTEILNVTHYKADGSAEELGSPVIPLKIESILVEGDTELRDLKPQAILPLPPLWPWVLAGLLLTMFLGGGLAGTGLWLYHRWKLQTGVSDLPLPVIDLRPPEAVAYAELDRIESLNLPAKKQFKEHYSLVTDCLRRYIEGRYQIPALERTTGELRTAFAKSLTPVVAVRDFLNVFMESDLVKFARFQPYSQDAYNIIDKARLIVEATTPEPEPVDEPAELDAEMEATA